ncbi:GH39 family glycosyl hydrolase [Streptomyces tsukubensis]|uniref:Xylan 1,4-beta-xylosidase n=1 Tax=Streptomyces tsukubensis TaxID=83656 RepID=A0A1V4AFE0_9ACTN|nr:xylan 1,4-beta-xylosidase [Streptomyces tsukubensis]OON82343.1 xylan 1,4-beta-xylosidase [Streptomyces tsukubensis]QFR92839.1 xylan 1,4-beta-xylosidase [Streptomyces tsukubensis]
MGRHGWDSGARRWRLTALFGVGVAVMALALTLWNTVPGGAGGATGTTPEGATVHGTPATPASPVRPELGWGFTHTQYSADEGDSAAVRRAGGLLSGITSLPQNQHLMGWGASNPEPVPGRYDFTEMDRRVDFIRSSGGTPLVTLCCAPDWMKGGARNSGHTDWSQQALETAPDRDHYRDFAKLAGTVARRYPDVKHFVVWNEFKGFWDDGKGRWDYEGYTELYNMVYAELKKVDKDILVGGPYLVMDSLDPRQRGGAASSEVKGDWGSMDRRVLDAFDYWNKHKDGADFVVVDGSSYTVDDELAPDEFRATEKFTAVGRWVRERTGDLPLWWAEYYVEPGDNNDDRDGWSEPHRDAVQAAGMIAMARGGATTGFYWNPQNKGADCAGCLWRSTELSDGGTELPMLKLIARFDKEFGPGTRYEKVSVAADDVANVRVLADDKALLVVNTLDRPISAKVDGRRFTMRGYEVKWLKR